LTHADVAAAKRARRLLWAYPKAWRARYGEEFLDLLLADIAERGPCWRRTADVVAHGLLARVSITHLPGGLDDPRAQVRSGLIAVGCAAAVFLTFGIAMWSQVVIGWRWRPPATPAVAAGMLGMSVAVLTTALLGVLAAAPMVWSALRAVRHRPANRLRWPVAAVVASAGVLVVGGLSFDAHWPGSGGRHWGSHGLIPSSVASFCWALTRGVSAYWFHPRELAQFNGSEIAWMVTSLVAIVTLTVGLTKVVRRIPLSSRVLRYEAALARWALIVMTLFAVSVASWVAFGRPVGPTGVYRVGVIDVIGLGLMGFALLAAHPASARMKTAGRALD
jgi:hypothetical protein